MFNRYSLLKLRVQLNLVGIKILVRAFTKVDYKHGCSME